MSANTPKRNSQLVSCIIYPPDSWDNVVKVTLSKCYLVHFRKYQQYYMRCMVSGQLPEWTQSRMDTIPNGHHPEWTQSRMDTIPNGHNPEWTQSRKDTIPNEHLQLYSYFGV